MQHLNWFFDLPTSSNKFYDRLHARDKRMEMLSVDERSRHEVRKLRRRIRKRFLIIGSGEAARACEEIGWQCRCARWRPANIGGGEGSTDYRGHAPEGELRP